MITRSTYFNCLFRQSRNTGPCIQSRYQNDALVYDMSNQTTDHMLIVNCSLYGKNKNLCISLQYVTLSLCTHMQYK